MPVDGVNLLRILARVDRGIVRLVVNEQEWDLINLPLACRILFGGDVQGPFLEVLQHAAVLLDDEEDGIATYHHAGVVGHRAVEVAVLLRTCERMNDETFTR